MYDLTKIKNEFYAACRKGGMDKEIPVLMNGRLTRTLGRVTMDPIGDKYVPTMVEFSKRFVETSTDFDIREVILHEAAHAIVTYKTGEDHGHDAVFKRMCAVLGTSRDKAEGKINRIVAHTSKYEVICPTCGVIAEFSRMCNTLRNIKHCSCRDCGSHNLTYIQNY